MTSTWILALFAEGQIFTWRELVNLALRCEPDVMRRLKEQENAGEGSLVAEFQDLLGRGLIELVNDDGAKPEDADYTPRQYRLSASGREAAREHMNIVAN
jgi:hypothetical protein